MKTGLFFVLSFCTVLRLYAAGPAILENRSIRVSVDTATGRFSIMDLRSGTAWEQPDRGNVQLSQVQISGKRLQAELFGPKGIQLQMTMELDDENPELTITLSGDPDVPIARFLSYPYPFLPHAGDLFILPEHEGVGIPVDDFSMMHREQGRDAPSAPKEYNRRYRFYCGHDLSMSFWGYAGQKSSCMGIVETPNDAGLRVQSLDGRLTGGVEWDASRGTFGYSRTLRYVFFQEGGYNAICKRYRAYAFKTGLLKTLAEKAEQNPVSLRIARSALIWMFGAQGETLIPELQNSGMEQIVVTSPLLTPGDVHRFNEAGIPNGVYDCMRSVLPDSFMPKVFRMDPCDVREAWPDDIILMQNGEPFDYGWPKNGPGGQVYRTMDVCDSRKPELARERLEQNLKHRPMTVRFYDTLTAFPWTECYDSDHPTTRSQVREYRMEVLQAALDRGLAVGAEAGHIYAVPYATYFEGMNHSRFFYYQIKGHSLTVYDHDKPLPESHQESMRMEHLYRLPLWELVAHDCCVAYARWNTPNNKIHNDQWWDHADLWDILYATPPMYMFFNEPSRFFETYRERYLESYRNIVDQVLSKTAGQEMTEHRSLTKDKSVQQTRFANGTEVTVNFGTEPVTLKSGKILGSGEFSVGGSEL